MKSLAVRNWPKLKSVRAFSFFALFIFGSSLLFFMHTPKAAAAIAFDHNLGSSTNASCSSSVAFTTSSAASANTKIIVSIAALISSTTTFTVSGGGLTWHTDISTPLSYDGGSALAIASADAPSGLATSTSISVSISPATFNGDCYVGGASFTGLATGTGNDGKNTGASVSSNHWTGGAISTTDPNDLIFGVGELDFISSWPGPSCTPDTSYLNIHCLEDSVQDGFNDVYQIASGTTSYTAGGGFQSAVSGGTNGGISVAYKATNAAPNTPTVTSPTSGATTVSTKPTFSFSDTDPDGNDIQFTINLFQSNCSTSVSTFSMNSGQTGWSPTFNGTAGSGKSYKSSTAGTGVSFTTSTGLSAGTTYCWSVSALDPAGTNTTTTSGTRLFTTDSAPAAPSLLTPSNGQIGLKANPTFNLSGTESDGDYLNYEIQICSTSNCSSVVRTICEVSDAANSCSGSQTGWASQSQQSGTAYLSGQAAVYNYQFSDLSPNTQYWWRASAIDPGGSNTWSSASSINNFTIENLSTSHDINVGGTVNVQGNVCFGSC